MNRVVGYILAGGESRRMGTDKAALILDGRVLLERIRDEVSAVCPEVVLIDEPGIGAAGAVLRALERGADWSLVVACDMPGVTRELLARMSAARDRQAVIPETPDGRRHPLCALYHRSCLDLWRESYSSGVMRVQDIVSRLEIVRYPVAEASVRNVNTPEEWQAFLDQHAGRV